MAESTQRTPVDLINEAIELGADGDPDNVTIWREKARTALRAAFGEGDPLLARFDNIRYQPSIYSGTRETRAASARGARRAGVLAGLAMLTAALDGIEVATPSGPSASTGLLHPWVGSTAVQLWDAGHHRSAVKEAAGSIEVLLKAKLGMDGSATGLVAEAFSTKDPQPDRPRLRFTSFGEATQSWTDAHEGAGAFGRGCFLRIRNLTTHGHEPTEEELLESMFALSLLARWIDEAEVVRSSDDA